MDEKETLWVAVIPVNFEGDTQSICYGISDIEKRFENQSPTILILDKRFIEELGSPEKILLGVTTR